MNIAQFIKKLTESPGIYRMLDREGKVLYVGKAGNLKKRVSSYFKQQTAAVKTQVLVNQIASIEVTVTRTETEALLLESSLIKSLRPKYNVLLRDDKTYPYIHVTKHPFPRMEMYRTRKKPTTGNFFGPYPSATAARETLQLIQKVFKIRNCSDHFFRARTRPCLQYEIKRCTAPCVNYIEAKSYLESVQNAIRFLEGKSSTLIDDLTARMEKAVGNLAFEEASVIRDQIKALRLVQEKQDMVFTHGDADAIAMHVKPGFACIQCVTIRDGQVIASQAFFPSVPDFSETSELEDLWQETFEAFIAFYYLDVPVRIPSLILIDNPIPNAELLEKILSEKRKKSCQIRTKPRGAKKRWMDFATNNLELSIAERMTSSQTIKNRYRALEELLHCESEIQRMECFDISHTQGNETVASCVVFDTHGPANNQYRRFNIEGITKGDDYAAMKQALSRRFKRLIETGNLPDVLIIDGGKGQVSIANQVLRSLHVDGVKIIGIAKGPERKPGLERLILSDQQREISLPGDSLALHLLQHIRDEAHRFAITAHRKKRNKSSFESSLDSIEGIGPKRKRALLYRFGGIRDLAKAPVEEIAKVQGISQAMARKIYEHFRV